MKHIKRLVCAVCAIFITSVLSSCEAAPKRYQAVFTDVFDTVTEFTAYCGSQEEFIALRDGVHGELKRLHKIFDIYSPDSGISKVNDSHGDWIAAEPELIEVLELSKQWHERSLGQFNVAMGGVLSLWHDCRELEMLPDEDELKALAEHCDIDRLEIDGDRVRLTDSEMSIDLGAVAKGYSAEKTAEFAISMGGANFALSVGGNVVARGEKPGGSWEIGIEDPEGGLLTAVRISDCSVVTSGDYQRYFEIDGHRYHHIVDPQTLWPASHWRSVTVICPDSANADALSTALFCLDLDEGRKLLDYVGGEALWVSSNGEVVRSEGFSNYEN